MAVDDFSELSSNNFTHRIAASDQVDVSILEQFFDNTTNSYKYLYFLSLLDIVKRKKFDTLSLISFQDIVVEMLANAWYPHKYYSLSFGTQEQITDKLDTLGLEITEPILKFRDIDKKLLRTAIINSINLDETVNFISRYVPYRLIRPFFTEETKRLKDYAVNPAIINLSKKEFDTKKPLYCFNGENQKDCNAIILHSEWMRYLEMNYILIKGWANWEWLNYMQQKNPNVSNINNKLFMPQQKKASEI